MLNKQSTFESKELRVDWGRGRAGERRGEEEGEWEKYLENTALLGVNLPASEDILCLQSLKPRTELCKADLRRGVVSLECQ